MNERHESALKRLALSPLTAGFGVLFALAWTIACGDYPVVGPGPGSLLASLACGFGFFAWLSGKAKQDPDVAATLRAGGTALGVVTLAVLGGRFLFTFFPPWDSTAGAFLGLAGGTAVVKFFLQNNPIDRIVHNRGTRLAGSSVVAPGRNSEREIVPVDASALTPVPDQVVWAGRLIPVASTEGHLGVAGATASGKTLMHRRLLRCIAPRVVDGTDRRVLIYDLKGDVVSFLGALDLHCPIHIVNPFDDRAAAWDMAADFTSIDQIDDYVKPFVPERPHEHNPFFTEAAQRLLGGVFKWLILNAPGRWTLRDVVHLAGDADKLERIIKSSAPLEPLRVYFSDKTRGTLGNVLQQLANAVRPLEPIAKMWERATERVSLRRWVREECSVLVLGTRVEHQQSCRSINQAMFRFISDAALSREEAPGQDRLWFFIDELKDAGRLDGLRKLLSDGRSKGVRACIGFQTLPGLRAEYGADEAMDLLGNFANLSFLRLACTETARWAADRIGKEERFEYFYSSSTPEARRNQPNQVPSGENLVERPAVMPEELMNLPLATGGIVNGYHILSDPRCVYRGACRYPLFPNVPHEDFVPRHGLDRVPLSPWTERDEERLGIFVNDSAKEVAPRDAEADTAPPAPPIPEPADLPSSGDGRSAATIVEVRDTLAHLDLIERLQDRATP